MKDVVDRAVGVIDENGIIIACSDSARIGESRQRIREELAYSSELIVYEGATYRFVNPAVKGDLIVFVEGQDDTANKLAQIVSVSILNIKNLYDERFDKGSFIKNIILDNILPSDIYIKSNELHFSSDESRVVMVFRFQMPTDTPPYDIIQGLVKDKPNDYVLNIGEVDVVLVKVVDRGTSPETLERFAASLIKEAEAKHSAKILVGVSSVVENLKDLSRAYKEARISLEVGKVFDIEKPIMCYENLGIGRLIYQLPTTLCEIFLQEVFKSGSLESLDRETLMTVQSFFENNLNVSETSRKLFVHRNTLVYRLEKIKKLTGLDLREFDNAVTFKVALMVKKYLTSKPTKF